jgi:hypothetical protein
MFCTDFMALVCVTKELTGAIQDSKPIKLTYIHHMVYTTSNETKVF